MRGQDRATQEQEEKKVERQRKNYKRREMVLREDEKRRID